jgi:hypothetical protein
MVTGAVVVVVVDVVLVVVPQALRRCPVTVWPCRAVALGAR